MYNNFAKNIGVLIRAHRIFNQETMLFSYHAMMYPYLCYCLHVCGKGSAFKTTLSKLFIFLNKLFAWYVAYFGVHTLSHLFICLVFSNYINIILICSCTGIIRICCHLKWIYLSQTLMSMFIQQDKLIYCTCLSALLHWPNDHSNINPKLSWIGSKLAWMSILQ